MLPGLPIKFRTSHRAKFEEIDPFGHLNVNHYLSYLSENRFEGQRQELNLHIADLAKLPIQFHTRKFQIEFCSPVFLDSQFDIESCITEVGDSSCKIESTMSSANGQRVHAKATFHMVCVSKETGKPVSWPEDFINRFFK